MTAVDRPQSPGFLEPNRQIHSMRPDLTRKITALRQRLAALEAVLASYSGPENAGAPTVTGDPVTPGTPGEAVAVRDATPGRMRKNGSGAVRMRQA